MPALVGISVKRRDYLMEFNKLHPGQNTLEFSIHDMFLESMGSTIRGMQALATVQVNKTETMYQIDVHLEGTMQLTCDRCLDNFDCPIKGDYGLILKLSETENYDDDEIVYISPGTHEYDLSQFLFDVSMLSIPLKKTCDQAQKACNPEVTQRLSQIDTMDEDEKDPRWEELKKIKETEE